MNAANIKFLFEPLQIKGITLKSRFVVPSMQRGLAVNGAPTAQMARYFAERIEGGFALVMSESCAIDHSLATSQATATCLTAETAPAWAKVIGAVHEAGGAMFMQLWHEGATRRFDGEMPPSISPSGLIRRGVANGRAADADDLDAVRAAYVRSARLAKMAGADGIELHACHGYLLDQFLWSETNLRDDDYGGPTLENRLRFPAEIAGLVRAEIGPDMPLSIRLSQWKEADFEAQTFLAPGDVRLAVERLTAAGVDMFHISQRRFYRPAWPGDPRSLAGWFKAFTKMPVITNGSVGLDTELRDMVFGDGRSRVTARESLVELIDRFRLGEFDLVSVGRGSIGDGKWPEKVRQERFDEIRPFNRADLESSTEWDTFAFDAGVD